MPCRLVFRSAIFFMVVACGCLIPDVGGMSHAATKNGESPYVTVDLVRGAKPLEDVVRIISSQTGYRIQIPEEWKALQVRGRFRDVPVEMLFRRILREESISIIIDEKKKRIFVESFQHKISSSRDDAMEVAAVDPMTGMLKEDLAALQATQLKELELAKSDADAIDPETGVRRGELEELHRRQLDELSRLKNDPDAMDPETGVVVGELREIQRRQAAELETEKTDPDAIDPETGVRREELYQLQATQLAQLEQSRNDPDSIDPETGVRREDLETLKRQQLSSSR